jgi:hypothetical protein
MGIESALKDTAGSSIFLLFQFPGSISKEIVQIQSIPSDIVLKLFALTALVFVKFLEVGKSRSRRLYSRLLSIYGLSKQLFC